MPDAAPRIRGFDYTGPHRYSLTVCTHARAVVFTDHAIVDPILLQIREAAAAFAFVILAYCFMPDHVHVVVEGKTDEADLKRFVKAWKQKTGFEFAKRSRHRLWQVGFFDHVLRSDESTERQVKYVLGNPVRAGLARTIGEYPFAGCHLPEIDRSPETDQSPET